MRFNSVPPENRRWFERHLFGQLRENYAVVVIMARKKAKNQTNKKFTYKSIVIIARAKYYSKTYGIQFLFEIVGSFYMRLI